METSNYIERLFMSWFSLFSRGRAEKTKKSAVKFGYDKNGMPFIDMSDRKTAQIFKKKLEAFEGIKTN
ncbi:hypothetical protein AN214_01552 [Pseudoalteromonas sp. P1-9]|uniref:hypothetical protein n=1 Tax=Pseudoalteromonas sp. P1-9 TaxID=1710354 RepID=UPI0006D63454|nr:hypothetical protein [Pseudoalteromonas sp. P1-9]KPV96457.1 hypothetical protein AN214_01552 [Pseudoalteromonas sp. P1-9]